MRNCSIKENVDDKAILNVNNEYHKVLCGSTKKFISKIQGIREIVVEKNEKGKWGKSPEKDCLLFSNNLPEVNILWLKVGKYRIQFIGDLGELEILEVDVINEDFDIIVKSQKGGLSVVGRFVFPIIVRKRGGVNNDWRFKYRISIDDGISWSNVKEVVVDYGLYGNTYSLNYGLYVPPGYGDVVVRFKLVDGRDFCSMQCQLLEKETVFVLHRIPMDLKGIMCDKKCIKGNRQIVSYGSESEYSCHDNERNLLKWLIVKESNGKLIEADKSEYSMVRVKYNYFKVVWHSVGAFFVCLYNKGDYEFGNSIVYKQAVEVVESDFAIKVNFKYFNNGDYRFGVFPLEVQKVGGANNNWKFKYRYGIEEDDYWSDEYWHFVDYEEFGDVFEFSVLNNLTKEYKGKKLVVKILEARDYNNALNQGGLICDEIIMS